MRAPVLANTFFFSETETNVLPNIDALSTGVMHAASKKALEGRFILPTATP
jgi:hypothetical protein